MPPCSLPRSKATPLPSSSTTTPNITRQTSIHVHSERESAARRRPQLLQNFTDQARTRLIDDSYRCQRLPEDKPPQTEILMLNICCRHS